MSLRLLLLPILSAASVAIAATAPLTLGLTPEASVEYALKHNTSLSAARLAVEEARGRLNQSGRLSNPELDLEIQKKTRGRESSAMISLNQRFPLTGRLRLEKAVSRTLVAAAESEIRDAERKLAAEVRSASIKRITLREQNNLRSNQLSNIRELLMHLRKLVQSGECSPVDALQTELELNQLEIENLRLQAEDERLASELRTLLGASPQTQLQIIGALTPPKESAPVSPQNSSKRADIQAAQFKSEAARLSLSEQQARRLEDVSVGLSYTNEKTIDDPNPIQTDRMIGLRFSVPLPLWNRNSGRIQEASAAATKAEKELHSLQAQAAEEAFAAKRAMALYSKILSELDSSVLPKAQQLEEQLRNHHASGQTPLLEVLRARSRRLDLQGQRLDALRDYHLALIQHSCATNQ